MKANLHITLTEFKNESRILKITETLARTDFFTKIYIFALGNKESKRIELVSDKIEVRRLTLLTRNLGKSFFWQTIKIFEFYFRAIRLCKRLEIGVVNVHSLLLLPLGFLIKLFFSSKLIYDTHELETEVDGTRGFRKGLFKLLERKLVYSADNIFVVSRSISEWYAREYQIPPPPVILNLPKLICAPQTNYLKQALDIGKESKVFLYIGGLVEGRGINLILKAFENRNNLDAVVVFIGFGPLEKAIKESTKLNSNVFFHPPVSPNEIVKIASSADVGLILTEDRCLNHNYCLPNKLFECTMAGLPVIITDMEEKRRFVEDYDIGIVLKEETVESLNLAIEKALKIDLKKLAANSLKAAIQNNWEMQEPVILRHYRELLEREKT